MYSFFTLTPIYFFPSSFALHTLRIENFLPFTSIVCPSCRVLLPTFKEGKEKGVGEVEEEELEVTVDENDLKGGSGDADTKVVLEEGEDNKGEDEEKDVEDIIEFGKLEDEQLTEGVEE